MFRRCTSPMGLLAVAFVLGLVCSAAQGQDAKKPANVAGNWKWQQQGRQGGEAREITLKLKQDGEKVTGVLVGGGQQARETEIKDGKVSGDTLSFTVTREFNNNTMTQKYSGKVEGDKITGKIATERDGQAREREWMATREKAAAAASPVAGKWKMEREFNGNTFVSILTLQVEGQKLTGTSKFGDRPESSIENGKVDGNTISYSITRERQDGTKSTSKFTGKVEGDKLVGETTANFGGEERTFETEYTRVKE